MAKDAGIDKLREVAAAVPGEMPKLGRAYLDNMLMKATAGGGFEGAQGLLSQWRNLGPETKKILFPDASYRQQLDNFFTLARMMAANPNPSGTAYVSSIGGQIVLAIHNPMTGVPLTLGGAALSKLLRSPAGVQALVTGITPGAMPGGGTLARSAAAKTAALANLVRLSQGKNNNPPPPPSNGGMATATAERGP
jgi:hypothetical protein